MKTSQIIRGVVIVALLADVPTPSKCSFTPAHAADIAEARVAASSPGLHFATEFTDGAALVIPIARQRLTREANFQGRGRQNAPQPVFDSLKAGPPMAICDLSLEDILHGHGLEAVQTINGYYYIIENAGKSVAYAETVVDRTDAAVVVDAYPIASEDNAPILLALKNLAALDQVRAGSFEVRLLRFPREFPARGDFDFNDIIWLKSDAGSADFIYVAGPIPKKPMAGGIQVGKLYAAEDFLKIIRPLAQQPSAAQDPTASADHPETTQARLETLQSTLQMILDGLNKDATGKDDGFVDKAIAELKLAQADAAQGLAYVQAHPEANALPSGPPPMALPYFGIISGEGFVSMPAVKTAYPNSAATVAPLKRALSEFLSGAPGRGGQVIGTIGGYRDKILQGLSMAPTELVNGFMASTRNGSRATGFRGAAPPAPEAVPENPLPAKPGAISGVVVDTDGDPVPFALIGFTAVQDTTRGNRRAIDSRGTYPPGHAVTVANDQGAFTVPNLPPGEYIITGSLIAARGGWRMEGSIQPVEVKEAMETKLTQPLKLGSGF